MPRPRGRNAAEQANLEHPTETPVLEGLAEGDGSKAGAGAASQPHLPAQTPTLLDKLDAAIRSREDEIGAIKDKRLKSNARWDAEEVLLRRDAETLRLTRERLLLSRWPPHSLNSPPRR